MYIRISGCTYAIFLTLLQFAKKKSNKCSISSDEIISPIMLSNEFNQLFRNGLNFIIFVIPNTYGYSITQSELFTVY